jgi:hypothetical protein
MSRESVSNYLPKFSLCFRPVDIGHLAKAFCNPVSIKGKVGHGKSEIEMKNYT